MSSTFYRSCIQLSGRLLGLCIESVSGNDAHLIILQDSHDNNTVQLWKASHNDVKLHCDLQLLQHEGSSSCTRTTNTAAILFFKPPSTKLATKISVSVITSKECYEIGLHYPSASDSVWLSTGENLENHFLTQIDRDFPGETEKVKIFIIIIIIIIIQ